MFSFQVVGSNSSIVGRIVAERARIPSTKKYRVRTVLIRSLGKNLKRRKSDSRTALPMNGNRIACSFDTVSEGGAGLTER
jgi:fumarylacetoacetate (FAA) hydrolase family protein